MRINRSLVLSAAVAFGLAGGCEVHERDSGTVGVGVGVQADVAVDEPQGMVVDAPGVVAIDVEPDPAQRVYVYDEGFPPGVYLYDNFYYYGGYRYPHDVFVNRYVQENIRQHRFTNVEENRSKGKQIEQRQRTEFTKTHGVRQNRAVKSTNGQPARQSETPGRQPETPRANVERPENRTPVVKEEDRAKVGQPENRAPAAKEENRANVERPENKTPTAEEKRTAAERPENKTPTAEERRTAAEKDKAKPANEERKPGDKEDPNK